MIFSNNVSYFCLEKVVVMIAFRNFGRYRKLLVNFNEMSYRTIRLYFVCIISSGKSQKRSHYARNIPQKHKHLRNKCSKYGIVEQQHKVVSVRAFLGTRTPDLFITNELLYQLS